MRFCEAHVFDRQDSASGRRTRRQDSTAMMGKAGSGVGAFLFSGNWPSANYIRSKALFVCRNSSRVRRYSTCRSRGWSSGREGWSKSSSGSRVMPSRTMRRRDGVLETAVKEMTSSSPSSRKAKERQARAASQASPLPQNSGRNRHPISTG